MAIGIWSSTMKEDVSGAIWQGNVEGSIRDNHQFGLYVSANEFPDSIAPWLVDKQIKIGYNLGVAYNGDATRCPRFRFRRILPPQHTLLPDKLLWSRSPSIYTLRAVARNAEGEDAEKYALAVLDSVGR